jgi:hypothetical protein
MSLQFIFYLFIFSLKWFYFEQSENIPTYEESVTGINQSLNNPVENYFQRCFQVRQKRQNVRRRVYALLVNTETKIRDNIILFLMNSPFN